MASTTDYRRALEAALYDPDYEWGTALGNLVRDDILSALKSKDPAFLAVACKRLSQYQMAVSHPDAGCVAPLLDAPDDSFRRIRSMN